MTRTYQQLLNGCLKLLSLRPRSRKEITEYLKKKTSDQDLIDKVLDRLISLKFIDDTSFTAWLVESRSRSRPRGRRLLEQELKSKGVAIDDQLITINEKDLAVKAISKKLHRWQHLSRRDFRIKASRFLSARGFSWDAIETTLKSLYNKDNVN
ncbi:MAG: RecX: regulatory protein [Candidatus Amesbacteria bacterium GW2011_GWB1_47_19]|nr:MAG: RecX: regulatory protein [Candidatus Amesbacteria bacterium GW2011_GWA1_44_24]KKU31026.1 MAG: RecX: regulatory protein [Candidatus Amesbacteria bacterium GW2011_GWC1_46_24]KKU65926.1 MAG: RecX: regulatory protein [Candidatus Amesbacteria bacterium GW2011_GWB1_47_19]OGD05540.1 MAG: hypothetical protein A2379_01105 [Candidatus Amesbacteria bacterium RIFOXYB1_FULL_47_13]HBC73059.1 hypothetical protein [Candidatus Amesbacteria bacterium]